MSIRSSFTSFIRKLGGAQLLDRCRFHVMRFLNRDKNAQFRKEFPDTPLPPAYLVYESFQMNYRKYFVGGRETAMWIAESLRPYLSASGNRILDWGCGPARVIRHLPEILGDVNSYFGCDYNPVTIRWCKENIPGITFSLNQIKPPLPYEAGSFDAVYGISIFTHLSEENHTLWLNELHRVQKTRGVLLITTHGDAFRSKLTSAERNTFDQGKLVVRSNTREGHRTFGAFHPVSFMRSLFGKTGFEIIEHKEGRLQVEYIEQDTWVLRKEV